jgi:hypothetical protein
MENRTIVQKKCDLCDKDALVLVADRQYLCAEHFIEYRTIERKKCELCGKEALAKVDDKAYLCVEHFIEYIRTGKLQDMSKYKEKE